MKNEKLDMGEKSQEVFGGTNTSESSYLTYVKSTELVIPWFKQKMSQTKTITDIGSHSGSFLSAVQNTVDLSHVKKVAIEANKDALNKNLIANEKITASAESIPLPDNFSDLTILRYVLQWNPKGIHTKILKEALRITDDSLLLQVPAVTPIDQEFFHDVFSTINIERTRRSDFYFPTEEEMKTLLADFSQEVTINKLPGIAVRNVVDVLKDRYSLTNEEFLKFTERFAGHDNWTILSWILEKKKA